MLAWYRKPEYCFKTTLDLSVRIKYSSEQLLIFTSELRSIGGNRTPEREKQQSTMAYVKCAICVHDQINALYWNPKHDIWVARVHRDDYRKGRKQPPLIGEAILCISEIMSMTEWSNDFENIINVLHLFFWSFWYITWIFLILLN